VDYIVRKANDSDNINIAMTLAFSFEKTLSPLTKDMECMAKIFENGVDTSRFYVAEQDGEFIGVAACADRTGRALRSTKAECKKHLGYIRGTITYRVLCSELMKPFDYPAATANIDVVGVLSKARGKGVAKQLIQALIKNHPQYTEFILDVASNNPSAIKSYTDIGFVEFKRENVKFTKIRKIFMKYTV